MSESFSSSIGDELTGYARLPREPLGVGLVRLSIGGFLLVTAALKVLSPAESAAMAVAYHFPPWATAAIVQAELALAALLLYGCWPKQTLLVAAVTFAIFGAFSVYRGMAGYESCGCFGSFKVNPWITASLDGAMLILVTWAAWGAPTERSQETRRFYLAGAAYALAGMLAAAGMIANTPTPVSDAAFSEAGGLIILEPESWIGQPFPLVSELTPKVSVQQGRWTVLLYHHDCPHCQEAMPQYERLAAASQDRRVLLIETPPYGENRLPEGAAVQARLTDAREWFVQTPIEIQVDEGVVVSASLDLPAIAVESSHFSDRVSTSAPSSRRFAD